MGYSEKIQQDQLQFHIFQLNKGPDRGFMVILIFILIQIDTLTYQINEMFRLFFGKQNGYKFRLFDIFFKNG